jgi:hypothetical protein
LREKILAHDIVIFGSPIWLGQIGSVAKRVLERMDAFLAETDELGRMPSYGKVRWGRLSAMRIARIIAAPSYFRRLTMWAGRSLRWRPAIGLARQWDRRISKICRKRLRSSPRPRMVAGNAAHLARLLKQSPYSG